MGKKNELEQDLWGYPLSLDTAKPPSTARHAVGQANKNNTITLYTQEVTGKYSRSKTPPFARGGGDMTEVAKGTANLGVSPIT